MTYASTVNIVEFSSLMALQKKICASSMEELQKALSDKGLTVSPVPKKGRCLFTTRDFSPGLPPF